MVFRDESAGRRPPGRQAAASTLKERVERLESKAEDLERRGDRLALACQALWELLRDKTGIAESAVFEKMHEIDLRDGAVDGRMTPRSRECRSCKRPVRWERRSCLYCGCPVENPSVSDVDL